MIGEAGAAPRRRSRRAGRAACRPTARSGAPANESMPRAPVRVTASTGYVSSRGLSEELSRRPTGTGISDVIIEVPHDGAPPLFCSRSSSCCTSSARSRSSPSTSAASSSASASCCRSPKGPGVILVFAPIDRMVRVEPAHGRHRRAAAGRHHARQRVGEGERGRLLPRHGPAARRSSRWRTTTTPRRSSRRRRCAACSARCELDDLLSERERLNQQLQQILDQHTDPWGIKVSAVEVKHVDLPRGHAARDGAAGRSRAREAC